MIIIFTMATESQLKSLKKKIREYKTRYLKKAFKESNESDTRIMVNYFLSEILGYTELEEIKTEYRIKSEYADYVIQLKRKKQFVVEVKSIEIDLDNRHLRQSLSYAANEGIDWILLLNGRQIQLYRVNFSKPVTTTLIANIDLLSSDGIKKAPELLWHLTKKAVEKGELEVFWKRTSALDPANLAKLLYSEEIIKRLRNDLKDQTGIYFQVEDVADSLCEIITKKTEFPPRPRMRVKRKPVKKRKHIEGKISTSQTAPIMVK